MTVGSMGDARGAGEAAAARRRRNLWTLIGVLFATGFTVGLLGAFYEAPSDGGWMTGTLPPGFAIAAAVATLLALTIGSVLFIRRVDELERQDNLFASAFAANVVMIGYPVWFILWKGGWVAEPAHGMLFAALFVSASIAYLYRKFR